MNALKDIEFLISEYFYFTGQTPAYLVLSKDVASHLVINGSDVMSILEYKGIPVIEVDGRNNFIGAVMTPETMREPYND